MHLDVNYGASIDGIHLGQWSSQNVSVSCHDSYPLVVAAGDCKVVSRDLDLDSSYNNDGWRDRVVQKNNMDVKNADSENNKCLGVMKEVRPEYFGHIARNPRRRSLPLSLWLECGTWSFCFLRLELYKIALSVRCNSDIVHQAVCEPIGIVIASITLFKKLVCPEECIPIFVPRYSQVPYHIKWEKETFCSSKPPSTFYSSYTCHHPANEGPA